MIDHYIHHILEKLKLFLIHLMILYLEILTHKNNQSLLIINKIYNNKNIKKYQLKN
jgi:hypothetical protein